MQDCKTLLKSVSRSFYLSMAFLPREIREAVSTAYMMARAADTVADTALAPLPFRLDTLQLMDACVTGQTSSVERNECIARIKNLLAPHVDHDGERSLLQRYDSCCAALEQLPTAQRLLVQRVLHTIDKGLMWDLEFFSNSTSGSCKIASEQDTLLYTYWVAGCVGEFWTDLAFETWGDSCALLPREVMRELGKHYGQGLQVVNILRDRHEDADRGRIYVPPNDENIQRWMERGRLWLREGEAYAAASRGKRMRFASILPAWLGLQTMELGMSETEMKKGKKKKVTRAVVRRLMVKALLFAWRRPTNLLNLQQNKIIP